MAEKMCENIIIGSGEEKTQNPIKISDRIEEEINQIFGSSPSLDHSQSDSDHSSGEEVEGGEKTTVMMVEADAPMDGDGDDETETGVVGGGETLVDGDGESETMIGETLVGVDGGKIMEESPMVDGGVVETSPVIGGGGGGDVSGTETSPMIGVGGVGGIEITPAVVVGGGGGVGGGGQNSGNRFRFDLNKEDKIDSDGETDERKEVIVPPPPRVEVVRVNGGGGREDIRATRITSLGFGVEGSYIIDGDDDDNSDSSDSDDDLFDSDIYDSEIDDIFDDEEEEEEEEKEKEKEKEEEGEEPLRKRVKYSDDDHGHGHGGSGGGGEEPVVPEQPNPTLWLFGVGISCPKGEGNSGGNESMESGFEMAANGGGGWWMGGCSGGGGSPPRPPPPEGGLRLFGTDILSTEREMVPGLFGNRNGGASSSGGGSGSGNGGSGGDVGGRGDDGEQPIQQPTCGLRLFGRDI